MKKFWPYCIIILLTLIFFFRFLDGLEIFAFKDLSRYFSPLRFLMVEQVKSGHIPLWNPYIFCGTPFLAALQICFFYPLTFIYYFIPFNLAFNYYVIIHYFLAAVFMYLLVRHYRADKSSAIFSGIVFTFSGYLLSVSNMNTTLSSVIWLPIALLFWDKLLLKIGGKSYVLEFFLFSLFLSLMFLGGEPTIIYVSLWFLGFYSIVLYRFKIKTIFVFILAIFFVVLITSVQLLPFVELVKNSDRAFLTQYDLVSLRSLPPREILNFVFPFFFGNPLKAGSYSNVFLGTQNQDWLISTYFGFIPLFFCCIAMFVFRGKRLFFAMSAFVSLVLAFGNYTPIYYFFYKVVPGISFIRYPVKYFFIFSFCISILAGFGLNDIANRIKQADFKWIKSVLIVLGCFSLVFGSLFLILKANEFQINSYFYKFYKSKGMNDHALNIFLQNSKFNFDSMRNLCVEVFLLMACFYLVLQKKIKIIFFVFIMLTAMVLDLFSANSSILFPENTSMYNKIPPNVETLIKEKDIFRFFYLPRFNSYNTFIYGADFDKGLLESKDRLAANRVIPYHLYDFYGYESIIVNDFRTFIISFWENMIYRNRDLFDALNNKYIINEKPLNIPGIKLLRKTSYGYMNSYLYENLKVMPRAFLVYKAQFFESRDKLLEKMKQKDFNPKELVLLEGKEPSLDFGMSYSKTKIVNYDYGNISISVETLNPAYLFLSDVYYDGWKVFIDGKESKILRANFIFRAIKIPPGNHMVRVVYQPLSFKIGMYISFVAIILFILGLGFYFFIDKTKKIDR